ARSLRAGGARDRRPDPESVTTTARGLQTPTRRVPAGTGAACGRLVGRRTADGRRPDQLSAVPADGTEQTAEGWRAMKRSLVNLVLLSAACSVTDTGNPSREPGGEQAGGSNYCDETPREVESSEASSLGF